MTTPHDATDAPESLEDYLADAPSEDDARSAGLFNEINERRARVENPELLQHLRSL